MPAQAASLLGDSLERSTRSTGTGVATTLIGLALALWSTTSAATTLMKAVTSAFDRDDGRGFVRKRAVSLVLVTSLVGAAGLVMGLLVLGPHLERWVGNATGAPSLTAWVWWTAQWPILIGALLFAFAVTLYLGPDVEQPRRRLVTPGAVVSLVIWLVASAGFALYASRFGSYDKTWGTLSAVVVTLVWLWLTSAALLFGAEVDAAVMRREAAVAAQDPAELDAWTRPDRRLPVQPRG
jgi:membrane protein